MTQSASPAEDSSANIWTSYHTRDRTLLIVGSAASYWMFSVVARLFSYPIRPGYEGSLLLQPSPLVLLIMTAVVLLACVLVTSFFAGIVHYEAGLFCACVGLAALSVRGGPMRYVLMASPGNGIFMKLMIELVLLFVCVWIGWLVLLQLRNMNLLKGEPAIEEDADVVPAQGFMALGGQVVIMIVLMLIMTQTDKKSQAVWSVALSAFLAAWGTHSLFPARPSAWFWTGPLIVGFIGYMLAMFGGNGLPGGAVGGLLPALARPLPLDYASVGVAGSIFGYWMSQWEVEHEPQTPAEVEQALEHPPGTMPAA
jgi:hypothetical protein